MTRSYTQIIASSALLLSLGFASAAVAQSASDSIDPVQYNTPTSEVILRLPAGTSGPAFAVMTGAEYVLPFVGVPEWHIVRLPSVEAALSYESRVRELDQVLLVSNNYRTNISTMSFFPNDTWFFQNSAYSGFYGQWHLINPYVPGRDVNIQTAWANNWTGQGVVVGIVDDSVQITHPDLAPNAIPSLSYNFGQNNPDPAPIYAGDNHGTAVAGVAVARGGNNLGVTGAAPLGGLSGLRVDFPNQTQAMFLNAVLFNSSRGVANIQVKNHSYGYTSPFVGAGNTEANAVVESTNTGTIHVYAAGNNRPSTNGSSDTTRQAPQNHPDVIAIAAFGSNGQWASYSNFGSCVTATAPSSTNGGFGIVTTDRTGAAGYNGSQSLTDRDYTQTFGGTSSAAPLAAGVIALAKEAQPNLTTRLAKHVIARTAQKVHPANSGWITNGAGFDFNVNYGFGMMNATGMVELAPQFEGVSRLRINTLPSVTVNQSIPDNNTTGITRTFTLPDVGPLEEVSVRIQVTHSRRGDVTIDLTSPSGTTARLAHNFTGSGSNFNWWFRANQFWGENAEGTWIIRVADVRENTTGTWNNFEVSVRSGEPLSTLPTVFWQNPNGSSAIWSFKSQAVAHTATVGSQYGAIVASGDFNADGKTEYITQSGNNFFFHEISGSSVTSSDLIQVANWTIDQTGDFNGNGRTDLLWKNASTGQYAIWLMNGNNVAQSTTFSGLSAWTPVVVADLDGDGNDDIIWKNSSTSQFVGWRMNGITILASGTIATAPNWDIVGTGDFNRDRRADLIWANSSTGQHAMWLMNGFATTETRLFNTGAWEFFTILETNRDDQDDILWYNSSTNQVAVWLMVGTGVLEQATLSVGNYAPVGTIDFNGDAITDVVFRNSAGQLAIWEMDRVFVRGSKVYSAGAAWIPVAFGRS
ncbi:MAG: S8 family serine peptidase [Fimbriimonadaceae bacterium]